MKILLDTCVAFWLAVEPEKLSAEAMRLVGDGNVECLLSAVSAWEISMKYGAGKLVLPEPPQVLIPQLKLDFSLSPLPFDESAAIYGGSMPYHHKDPFDRMLVCQSIAEGVPVLTPDLVFNAYPIRRIW